MLSYWKLLVGATNQHCTETSAISSHWLCAFSCYYNAPSHQLTGLRHCSKSSLIPCSYSAGHKAQQVACRQTDTRIQVCCTETQENLPAAATRSCVLPCVSTQPRVCLSVRKTGQEFLLFKPALPFPTSPCRERADGDCSVESLGAKKETNKRTKTGVKS